MSGRVYQRKFDWDRAIRLRADGVPIAEIAARLGVSYSAVYRIVTPGAKAKMDSWAAAYSTQPVPCIEGCGRTVTLIGAKYYGGRCVECAAVKRSTTARGDELYCRGCGEWKPDDAFPRDRGNKYGRRGRHAQCRACQTRARQDYRNRHKVPCVDCGAPSLPPSEKRTGGHSEPRCRTCWYAWQRQPEQRAAARQRSLEASARRRANGSLPAPAEDGESHQKGVGPSDASP